MARAISGAVMRRNLSRRTFALAGLASAAVTVAIPIAGAQPVPPHPARNTFQSGDFIWPKKSGAIVPYSSGETEDLIRNEERWYAERDQFLGGPHAAHLTPAEAQELRSMNFREFYH